MMSNEQMVEAVLQHSREITALQESAKSAHHRISETAGITAGVNDLARSVAEMAVEIKHLAKNISTSIDKIGKIESRLDEIDKMPGQKWDKLVWMVLGTIVTAIVAYTMGKIL